MLLGHMLYHWMSSTLQLQTTTKTTPKDATDVATTADVTSTTAVAEQPTHFAPLLLQFCTNLLVAGVIKQIPDSQAPEQDTFRVS